LLQFLAASPLLANGAMPAFAQGTMSRPADPLTWAPRDLNKLIENPGQALDVFDFEPVMKTSVPPAHFWYMATGVDDEVTLRANREAFQKLQLRPRRLIDVSQIDMRTDILGTMYDSPIVISPTSSNKAFHPDGELAVARAAKAGNHLQMLSTVATTSIEDAIAARGAPVWFQLYPTQKWEVAEALVTPAERTGSPVIVVTRPREAKLGDAVPAAAYRRPSMWDLSWQDHAGLRRPQTQLRWIDLTSVSFNVTNLTWDFVKRLRDTVRTKICSRVSSPTKMRSWPRTTALTASLSQTTGGALMTAAAPRSTHCRKLSRWSARGCRC
jgi:4-hydroxymandelate oxidase